MKKALHKLTLAVLIAAFILTLAGCGSDDTLKKNITGSWACRGIDVTDMILEGMLEGVSGDAEAEEFISISARTVHSFFRSIRVPPASWPISFPPQWLT